MVHINPDFQKLKSSYLFPRIEEKKRALLAENKEIDLINLGIGDITKPMLGAVYEAFQEAIDEMKKKPIGYGPSQGYEFLREKICEIDYENLDIEPEEIFVSNGAKCDSAHLLEIFSKETTVALCDPAYPVYVDSTVMSGRTGDADEFGHYANILYLPLKEEEGFMPCPPEEKCDLVYLCSPNNPTGVALTKEVLEKWVAYAKKHGAIILYDGAYEAFISQDRPKSIYEIEGAKDVAIEIRSYSKTAGFTGLRCSYTVIPKRLKAQYRDKDVSVHTLWKRRHDTKFNGVNYLTQKAASSLYTPRGQKELKERIIEYQEQSNLLREGLENLGYTVYGGIDAPYLWVKTPDGFSSWEYFEYLLEHLQIVSIPGRGFGVSGEGFIRLSAFASLDIINRAIERFKTHETITA